ncbi:class I ribonucleotide reductase maintenance protein YfaE [Chimaeribacter arupi]|uniref:2Fe-2S ferredoxin n=2 Tax=Yersiniaceae TaxID=1903411 RepID=A0A2N5EPT2_9GAMM|nr:MULTISPECIES: class I ribonucleotide reductase maintenance protein YfaE [Yersiniaceae]MBS0970238.1 2Fe-2S ferredoxin-like protein [Nissabacter archeti]PLR38971.1 2Fe-2S ferredoxin [Chimaeribacter arupi]PLR51429.1 2Fe-2S ferredoxin [Chimaeribacter arupi]PLR51589.1 2Fe-2S ferredoxin [Chimaeribacter arupi]WKZ93483.1 class I ribonucleotide reductase maintenance protein YfaE [Chimaeribacter arupi]
MAGDSLTRGGHTILLRSSGAQLPCAPEHRCLLELLETHQLEVEYQCREGYCGACRVRLLKGSVSYHQTPLAFIQQGEILPCCCLPQEDIEIDI